ncbi:unnamed protein product [Effrenium voratum]|uniref:Pseudouridine synthase RsuA/RluA-like domain-containing protein n=1 Tax=Effrenium voratum TaxID=2562239 RepID=A0AA36MM49_9DINO|nr:unnamed protein product [Effrenium voratum]
MPRISWQLALFEINSEPTSIVTYNAAISACGKQSQWQRALHVLRLLQSRKVQASVVTYNAAMGACERNSRWQQALQFLLLLQERRLASAVTHLTAVAAAGKGRQWELACHLLSNTGEISAPERVASYNAALSAARGAWIAALKMLKDLHREELRSDVITFNAALVAGASWTDALSLLCAMALLRVGADAVSRNSVMASLRGGQWRLAVHLFSPGDPFSAAALARAAAEDSAASAASGAWRLAVQLARQVPQDLVTSNCALRGLRERWPHCLRIFNNLPAQRLQPDMITRTAVVSAGIPWQAALLISSHGDAALLVACLGRLADGAWARALRLVKDFSNSLRPSAALYTAAAGCAGKAWQVALALGTCTDGTEAVHGHWRAALSLGGLPEGDWPQAFRWLQRMLRARQAPGASCQRLVSVAGHGAWRPALELIASLPSFPLALCDAWLAETAKTDLGAARSFVWAPKRPPTSLLWALAAVHETRAAPIHGACREVFRALRRSPSKFALVTACWAADVLGAENPHFRRLAAEQVQAQLPLLSLPELSLALQSSGEVAAQRRVLELLGSHRFDFHFARDGKELLAIAFACHLAGGFCAALRRGLRRVLRRQGRALDAAGRSGAAERRLLPALEEEDMPRVVFGSGDRPVLLKPAGWEVYGQHAGLQLLSFARQLSSAPIHQDREHNYGFLHRLDVPSSGLILLARSYEAFYDLQLQLHCGQLQRSYTALSHGWAEPRTIRLRLYYHGAAASRGGRGKVAVSEVSQLLAAEVQDTSGVVTLQVWRIRTGRRHQIRASAAFCGHPLLRDRIYTSALIFLSDAQLCARNWLHRHFLGFRDAKGEPHEVFTGSWERDAG